MMATSRPSAEQAARRAPDTPASGIRAIGTRSGYESVASIPGSTTYMRSGSTKNSGNTRPGQRSTPPDAATTAVPVVAGEGHDDAPVGRGEDGEPLAGQLHPAHDRRARGLDEDHLARGEHRGDRGDEQEAPRHARSVPPPVDWRSERRPRGRYQALCAPRARVRARRYHQRRPASRRRAPRRVAGARRPRHDGVHGRHRRRAGRPAALPSRRQERGLRRDELPRRPRTLPTRPAPSTGGAVARYARRPDYHRVIRARLVRLGRFLAERAPGASWRPAVDTAPLLEKELAQRAGLGWIGKNTCLINRTLGSELLLGELVTDVALPPDRPETDHCGTCSACLTACPSRAFDGRPRPRRPPLLWRTPRSSTAAPFPDALLPSLGNRLFGCDACQSACPWNRRARPSCAPPLAPREHLAALPRSRLEGLDREGWAALAAGTPLRRLDYPTARAQPRCDRHAARDHRRRSVTAEPEGLQFLAVVAEIPGGGLRVHISVRAVHRERHPGPHGLRRAGVAERVPPPRRAARPHRPRARSRPRTAATWCAASTGRCTGRTTACASPARASARGCGRSRWWFAAGRSYLDIGGAAGHPRGMGPTLTFRSGATINPASEGP